MVIIIIGVLVIALLAFFSYELIKRINLDRLPAENAKMQRKINVYRQQENSRLIVSIIVALILISLFLLGILYQQYTLEQDNESLKTEIETRDSGKIATVEEYTENSLKLADFSWGKIVENQDAAALKNYELQLSREWQPFFGDVSVTIVRSQNTNSLTISVFSSSLAYSGFTTAEKNVEKFVKELGSVPEVAMLDFNFTYRDKTNTLTKASMVYSKDAQGEGLSKVELN
ncbi:hypothetical protein [uncultured Enterococcus sp.]|uniref:hypothetical protein n=1 Tax=uncultured Enterococcus sp. TaxID=167972 RepID=UPI002AA8C03F|nr:hypothetical protein [uncultured Enterococcus sp.]